MSNYFHAFVPGIYEESVPTLNAFVDSVQKDAFRHYDKESRVFSMGFRNLIYSYEDAYSAGTSAFGDFIKKFRSIDFHSQFFSPEIFCRCEGDEYWHAFAHDGENRTCCHLMTDEAQALRDEAYSLNRSADHYRLKYDQLNAKYKSEVNAGIKKFIDEFQKMAAAK